MHFFLHYLRPYARRVAGGMTAKFLGTIMELFLPWLLAYTLDEIAPLGDKNRVYLYGGAMLLGATSIVVLRLLAARNHWSLPKANLPENPEK